MLNTPVQNKIVSLKYAYKRPDGTKEKDWGDVTLRTVTALAPDSAYATSYYNLIFNLVFMPGGRILANAGTGIKSLMNCYSLGLQDSRQSIYSTLKEAAEVFAHGGGVGYNFSNIREEGAHIVSTGGQASGPLSFLTLFDQTGEVIQQASRRGAQLAVLNVDHPDIEKFIDFKSTLNYRNQRIVSEYLRNLEYMGVEEDTNSTKVIEKTLQDDQLTHFNVSVGITDEFMNCVITGEDFELKSVVDGKVVRKVNAKELLRKIALRAWESGDPGLLFLDTANANNMVPYVGKILGTNPCFHPDTLIETVEGRIKIKDMTKPMLVYTLDKDGKLTTRMSSSSFVTKKNAETLRIGLSNGKSLIVTKDHKVLSKKRGWVEAKDLLLKEQLVSLSRTRRGACYSGIRMTGTQDNTQVMEHRFVYEQVHGYVGNSDIHHKDGNTFNNSYTNLEALPHSEHARLTAYTQPNNHQEYDPKTRQFVSGPNSRKGGKVIVHVPVELASGYRSGLYVNSITAGPVTDVYDVTVEETHNVIANFVVAHNCGEVPMIPYESCCLGSLNLSKFVEQPEDESGYKVNWEFLEYATRQGIRFLDDVQRVSEAPLEPINAMSKGLRRLGLGVCGFADLLAEMEIPYNSETALDLANYISWFISFMAWQESFDMAEEKGAFEYYDADKVNREPLRRVFESRYVPYKFDYNRPVRNVAVTSLAPTGSIALVAGVNSGIEPFFALAYKRNITQGIGNTATDYVVELNPILFRKLKKYNVPEVDIEKIKEYVMEKGTVQGCELVPEKLRQVFVTAHEITPGEHIEMQASWQEYVSNSVSKTINLPHDATVEDIEQAIVLMWYNNLVGGTVYRDASKMFQVLNVGAKK